MKKTIKISIVIPVKEINDYILESSAYIERLDYPDFEVLILPDADTGARVGRSMIIPTGPVGPAEKRDLALEYATGKILAFLDDDAYPRPDWLRNAARHFEDDTVAAVGGPAVTPADDSVMQKASGAVFASTLTSAAYRYRYIPMPMRDVDDLPTVNLFIRKEVFEKLGGFDTTYWPGEDTKLCLDITKRLGLRIIYDPEVLVHHHRRSLFKEHLSQVSRYAYQRGCFVKSFPETSLRPGYFVPSAFLLFTIAGPLTLAASTWAFALYLSVMSIYLAAVLGAAISAAVTSRSICVGMAVVPGVIFTHLTYGYYFMRGLSSAKKAAAGLKLDEGARGEGGRRGGEGVSTG